MDMIRSLRQPGPVHPSRIDALRGDPYKLHFALKPGISLNEAVAAPLVEAGFQCGTGRVEGHRCEPVPLRDARSCR